MSSWAEQVLDDPLLPAAMSRAWGEGLAKERRTTRSRRRVSSVGQERGLTLVVSPFPWRRRGELVEAVMVEQDLAEMVTV